MAVSDQKSGREERSEFASDVEARVKLAVKRVDLGGVKVCWFLGGKGFLCWR